jgi:hypothetical protein
MIIKTLVEKTAFRAFLTILLFTSMPSMQCMFIDSDDEFDELLKNLSHEDLQQIRSCETGEAQVWNNFFEQFDLPESLNPDFYLQTELPRTRNLMNFPTFQICTYQDIDLANELTFHFFYNQTSQKNYTKSENNIDGTRIGSYINITQGPLTLIFKTILQDPTLATLFPALAPLARLNIPLLTNNVANMRLEERRMGMLAHWYHAFNDNTFFEFKIPFFWMVKNLQLTTKEKAAIEEELTIYLGTNFSNFSLNQYARQHIIFDAIGAGTAEVSLCTRVYDAPNWHVDGGAFFFLPTDHPWKKGMYGTYINPQDQQPILDFCSLVQNFQTRPKVNPDAINILTNYVNCSINQLASALLQCPLGYYQTFTVGLKLLPYWAPHEDLEFYGQYSVEFLFPYDQPRFYLPINNEDFADIYNAMPNTTDKEAQAKLDFFQARITELLFPRVFMTRLSPGFIVNSISSLHKTHKDWNFVVGYNGWVQLDENFLSIDLPKNISIDSLDIAKSMAQDAFMVKLYGKVHKNIQLARHILSATVWADFSVWSNTVGNDFTLGICFDTQF